MKPYPILNWIVEETVVELGKVVVDKVDVVVERSRGCNRCGRRKGRSSCSGSRCIRSKCRKRSCCRGIRVDRKVTVVELGEEVVDNVDVVVERSRRCSHSYRRKSSSICRGSSCSHSR